MNTLKPHTRLRLTLHDNGYQPFALFDKSSGQPFGWQNMPITRDAILKADRHGTHCTAVRLNVPKGETADRYLLVLDNDIDHPDGVEITRAMLAVIGLADTDAVLRASDDGHKAALFFSTAKAFRGGKTHWYTKGGVKGRVELFGGSQPRYFGVFGPKKYNRQTGETLASYVWPGRSLLDVPLRDLPEITEKRGFAMLDAAEARLRELGWSQAQSTTDTAPVQYRLEDHMVIELDDGRRVTVAELKTWPDSPRLRCSMSFIEGPTAKRRDRGQVHNNPGRGLAIYSYDGILYRHVDYDPKRLTLSFQENLRRLAALTRGA